MRRRELIAALLGAAAVWPLAAQAQQAQKTPLVGVLMIVAEHGPEGQARLKAFREGLAALGWVEGKNVRVEYRWSAGDAALVERYVSELLAMKPDVILANGTPVIAALKRTTKTVPIVGVLVTDPVRLGFVANLARPGGNITGFSFIDSDLIGKWRQLLSESAPDTKRTVLLFDPLINPQYYDLLGDLGPPPSGAPEIAPTSARTMAEVEGALATMGRSKESGLIIPPDGFLVAHLKEIAALAMQQRLPAISVYRQFALEGGLLSYGPDVADIFRRAAAYIDRILKGARPADLPVQQPTKFELVINLKTAKALGLALPPLLLAGADEVIE
ncbi:MAG TPA: ABC transporter substrate-binding protein [Alphaproteobacteria bacterium]|nr:ABC transporter substrate-binding protein [Alphaproteobacteria bacterium]